MLDEKRRIREIRIAEEEYFWHKGLEQARTKIVNNMLREGIMLDTIANLTGLTLSQVQSIQSNQQS